MNDPGHSTKPYLWMLVGSFAFAWMSLLAHALGDRVAWQYVALARSAIALVFIAVLVLANRVRAVWFRPARLWTRSIAGSLSMLCAFYALTRLPSSVVIPVCNTYPVWVAVLAWPMNKSVPSGRVWVAIAFAVCGVFLLENPEGVPENPTALLAAVAAAVLSGVALLGLNRLKDIDGRAVVMHFSGVAVVFCLLAFWLFEDVPGPGSVADSGSIALALGVGLSATVGQLFLTRAFTLGDPARVAVVGLTQVPIGLFFDVTVFGQTVGASSLIGIAMIALPTAWVMIEGKTDRPVPPTGESA